MTTANSPIEQLQAQAEKIADMLKRAERGESIACDPAGKIASARATRDHFKVAIMMDDKLVSLEIGWGVIRGRGKRTLAKIVLDAMMTAKETVH